MEAADEPVHSGCDAEPSTQRLEKWRMDVNGLLAALEAVCSKAKLLLAR
jgi:hypothetical protein